MAQRRGSLTVIAAAVLWGTAGTVGALASVDPVSLAAARLVIGGAVLALQAAIARSRMASAQVKPDVREVVPDHRRGAQSAAGLVSGSATGPTGGPSRASTRGATSGSMGGLVVGAVAVAAYQLSFFASVGRTGVAIGTVVAIGSGPVFTGLLSWLVDRNPPGRRWALATVAAIVGCAVLIIGGGAGGADAGGIALALLGGLLYASYAVMAAKGIARGMESGAVMGVLFGGAGVIMLPVLIATGPGWLTEPRGLLSALYLGLVTTALAYLLYGIGLRSTPVATAATLALAEPAVAALLGLLVLGEHLSGVSWGGLVLLGAALLIVVLPDGAAPAGEQPARRRAYL